MSRIPLNPFRWHAILETSRFYQTAEVNTSSGAIDSDPQTDVLFKPDDTPAVEAAKRTFLGQVYLDWGQWAVIRDVGQEPIEGVEPPHLHPIAPGQPSNSATCVLRMRSRGQDARGRRRG